MSSRATSWEPCSSATRWGRSLRCGATRGLALLDRSGLETALTTVLLDTHVAPWWSAEPQRVSARATRALEEADELAVCAISWFELAWLARHERIRVATPVRSWLEALTRQLRSALITPAIAETAVALPYSFPGDPADRLIYATAIEYGWPLITKDVSLRRHRHPGAVAVW